MIKKLIFAMLIFTSFSLSSKAQLDSSKVIVEKFKKYYNENKDDSLSSIFSSGIKSAINIGDPSNLIKRLRNQLGKATKYRYLQINADGTIDYELQFEKPIVDINLVVDHNLIVGIIRQKHQTSERDDITSSSPDNIYITTDEGNIYGTLTLPKAVDKKVPVVLLIGGSGPTDRNMNQLPKLRTNSFLLLAAELSKNGIASLRYDKRGIGTSYKIGQDLSKVVFEDLVNDACRFITLLKNDQRFSRIIVLGHSEGAAIGLEASLKIQPDAYVSLSGFAGDMGQILMTQIKSQMGSQDIKVASEILDSLYEGKTYKRPLPASLSHVLSLENQPYLMSSLKYNTLNDIRKLKIPILLVAGTADKQVATYHAEKLFKNNKYAELKIILNMNHVLKRVLSDAENTESYMQPNTPFHEQLTPGIMTFFRKNNIN